MLTTSLLGTKSLPALVTIERHEWVDAAWSRKTLSNFVLPALNCAEGRRRVLITIDTWRDFLGSKKSNSDEEILDAKTIMLDVLAQQNRAEIHSRLKF